MAGLNLFLPITKVDAVKREVWGVLAEETKDKAGEIFDYESSKPYFQKWNQDFAKATDGKSVGNLRSMHSPVAAGKFIAMEYDDENKCVLVGAKVVDDNEWRKVEEGVYTGFSVGGKYLKRWRDPELNAVRYTALPTEGSLVDNPCMYGATFKLIKAEGIEELKKFQGGSTLTEEQRGRLEELRKIESLSDEEKQELEQLEQLEKAVQTDAGKEGSDEDEKGNESVHGDNAGSGSDNEPVTDSHGDNSGVTQNAEGDAGTSEVGKTVIPDLEKRFSELDSLTKSVSEFTDSLAKVSEGFESLKKAHDKLSSSYDKLSKAYDELQKSQDALKEENKKLMERVEALEKLPADGGIVAMPIEKSLASGGRSTNTALLDEAALLKNMIDNASDLMVKQVLSQQLAMLEIKKVQASGGVKLS